MYISRVVTYMHTEYYVLRCTQWVFIHALNHEPCVITDDVCIVYTVQEVVLHLGISGLPLFHSFCKDAECRAAKRDSFGRFCGD